LGTARDRPRATGLANLFADRTNAMAFDRLNSNHQASAADKFPFACRRSRLSREKFLFAEWPVGVSPISSQGLSETENRGRTRCRLLGTRLCCGDRPLHLRKVLYVQPRDQGPIQIRHRNKREFQRFEATIAQPRSGGL